MNKTEFRIDEITGVNKSKIYFINYKTFNWLGFPKWKTYVMKSFTSFEEAEEWLKNDIKEKIITVPIVTAERYITI